MYNDSYVYSQSGETSHSRAYCKMQAHMLTCTLLLLLCQLAMQHALSCLHTRANCSDSHHCCSVALMLCTGCWTPRDAGVHAINTQSLGHHHSPCSLDKAKDCLAAAWRQECQASPVREAAHSANADLAVHRPISRALTQASCSPVKVQQDLLLVTSVVLKFANFCCARFYPT